MGHVSFPSDQLETLDSFLVSDNVLDEFWSVLLDPGALEMRERLTMVSNG